VSDIEAGFDLGEFAASSRLLCAIITRSGRVLWANDSLGRAFGPSPGAVVNRPMVELFDPYDRPAAVHQLTRLDDAGDEVAFDAHLHPVAGGTRLGWSLRAGRDGLLYLLGTESVPDDHDLGVDRPTEAPELATRDHLTGAADRRSFEVALSAQLQRCRRDRLPLSLAIVDVDGFKHYNDTYGHLAGDECLVGVAHALLQRAARTGELVGRFGGDEFLVLWPGSDATTASRNADDVRDGVRVLDLRLADNPVQLAVSVGGVTVVPSADTTGPELVDAADRAMYSAKRAGGDRTRWVSSTG
jgi:diguanylate cyclase (GGDEF)-like protein